MDRGHGGDKPEFSDLFIGKCEGRVSSEQITFDRIMGNQGLQFSSVSGLDYELSLRQGLGKEIPADWLLEDNSD